jgi:hypothetical protein
MKKNDASHPKLCLIKTIMKKNQDQGEYLIFLISLPRSGSTLLQHILASHSEVGATAEPWILFPAVCALKKNILNAEYNAEIARIATSEFLSQIEDGESSYYIAIRKMALHLYGSYSNKNNKKFFLDKTSRYYLALPEIFRVFPKAKYIFLFRNPLSILASFIEVMANKDWRRLGDNGLRSDLLNGFNLMYEGINIIGKNAITVKYEDIVENPEATMRFLCNRLEIDFEPSMLFYGKKIGVLPGRLVDPKSIHCHQSPVNNYVESWRSKISTPQQNHLAVSYLNHLGSQILNLLGYDFYALRSSLADDCSSWPFIVKWDLLMKEPSKKSRWDRCKINLSYAFQKRVS